MPRCRDNETEAFQSFFTDLYEEFPIQISTKDTAFRWNATKRWRVLTRAFLSRNPRSLDCSFLLYSNKTRYTFASKLINAASQSGSKRKKYLVLFCSDTFLEISHCCYTLFYLPRFIGNFSFTKYESHRTLVDTFGEYVMCNIRIFRNFVSTITRDCHDYIYQTRSICKIYIEATRYSMRIYDVENNSSTFCLCFYLANEKDVKNKDGNRALFQLATDVNLSRQSHGNWNSPALLGVPCGFTDLIVVFVLVRLPLFILERHFVPKNCVLKIKGTNETKWTIQWQSYPTIFDTEYREPRISCHFCRHIVPLIELFDALCITGLLLESCFYNGKNYQLHGFSCFSMLFRK